MPALSTWCRAASEAPAAWCDRATALGATSVALDAGLEPAWVDAFTDEARRRGSRLPVVALEAPCPRPGAGRAPRLASPDRDERRAAVRATEETLRRAAALGARVVVVALGRLDLDPDWRGTVRAYARGDLERGDVHRIVAERMRFLGGALDAARFGLEPVLDRADGAGVTIALVNRARWFEIPDEPERMILFDEFRGAPLRAWHDPAAAHAREALGFGRHADVLAAAAARCAGAWLTDAAGLRGGLPWGRGEVDRAAVLAALPAEALRIVHAAPGALDEELAEALRAA